ncbi:MAG: PAS domain-containing protein [Gammaproteobacteria bacterium]|nr:PAS domain-containing protein [Gammaproteobacteria bacterium]
MNAALEPVPHPEYDYCLAVVDMLPGFVCESRLGDGGSWLVLWGNPGFRQTFGVDAQEFEATGGWIGRVHPDDLFEAEHQREVLRRGGSVDGELRFMTTRGWRRLRTLAQAFVNPATGRFDRVIGCGIDITQEREAVEALQQSEARYRLATDVMSGVVYDCDLATGKVMCSAGVSRQLGYAEGEIGADFESWNALVHPEDRPRIAGALSRAISEGHIFEAEYRVRHRSGAYVHVWNRSAVQRDAAGQPIRVVGCTVDVTELRRTQLEAAEGSRRLQETTDLLQQAQEVAQLGSWSQRLADNHLFWSAETYKILGLPVGTPPTPTQLLQTVHPDDLERLRRVWFASLEPGAPPFAIEHRILANGEERWIRQLGRVGRDASGKGVFVLGTIQDITERKLLEREVTAIANREQERIGHDLHDGLGQELTGISLLLQGLSTRLAREYPALAPEAEAIAGLVGKSIRNTRAIAAGLSPLAVQRGGLGDALRALGARMRELYGVPTSVEISAGPRFQLGSHAEIQLYRIAQEAVTNAVRHAGARNITVRLTRRAADVELEVADDGCGLSVEPEHDAGLGLRIARYRADLINAEMRIESGPAGGTVVRVACPSERLGGGKP